MLAARATRNVAGLQLSPAFQCSDIDVFDRNDHQPSRAPGTLSLADLFLAFTLCSVGAVAIRAAWGVKYELGCAILWVVLAFLYWRSRMIATLLIHLTVIVVAAAFFSFCLVITDEGLAAIFFAIEPTLDFGIPLAASASLAYAVATFLSGRRQYL